MIVSIPVGTHGTFLGDGFGIGKGQNQMIPFRNSGREQHLHRVHGFAQITAAALGDIFQGTLLRNSLQGGALLHEGHGPFHSLQRSGSINLLEFENRRTA